MKAPLVARESGRPQTADRAGRTILAPVRRSVAPAPATGPTNWSGRDFTNVPVLAPESAAILPGFPHGSEIGRRLGGPFSATALFDPGQCRDRGVPAFTQAGVSHFQSRDPPLRIAAHEAAHVLQQKGATHDMGLGAEGQAAAIEHRVAAGLDAGRLLGPGGAPTGPGPHDYKEIRRSQQASGKWHAKKTVRVSDDGFMAVGRARPGHDLWAAERLIDGANATLEAQNSAIVLEKKNDELAGPAPDGGGPRVLNRVMPKNLSNATSGDKMKLWADCQRAAFAIMGVKGGTMGRPPARIGSVYNGPASPDGADGSKKRTRSTEPDAMMQEILKEQLGPAGGADAVAAYRNMVPLQRDKIDRRAGLNQYAEPKAGEAYAVTGDEKSGKDVWNYHWAGVLMVSGDDRVTLENFAATRDFGVKLLEENAKWAFQMYGPAEKPGQTFHEQHEKRKGKAGIYGKLPETLRVQRSDGEL